MLQFRVPARRAKESASLHLVYLVIGFLLLLNCSPFGSQRHHNTIILVVSSNNNMIILVIIVNDGIQYRGSMMHYQLVF
jgi:hypothetical protein